MADAYIGEIRLLPYGYSPVDWEVCAGQLLDIGDYTTLFSVIGTTYGGNGQTNFAVPNLMGRLPIGTGDGPGLTNRYIGQKVGNIAVSLSGLQIPEHNHVVDKVFIDGAVQTEPDNEMYLGKMRYNKYYKEAIITEEIYMSDQAVSFTGQSAPHENRQPFLALQYCICTAGIYPSRN